MKECKQKWVTVFPSMKSSKKKIEKDREEILFSQSVESTVKQESDMQSEGGINLDSVQE